MSPHKLIKYLTLMSDTIKNPPTRLVALKILVQMPVRTIDYVDKDGHYNKTGR